MIGGSKSGRTYDREDVRGLVSDVVEFFAVFGAFCVAGDDIVGDTLELLEGEADGTLMSPVQLHLPTYICVKTIHTFSSLKFFYCTEVRIHTKIYVAHASPRRHGTLTHAELQANLRQLFLQTHQLCPLLLRQCQPSPPAFQ